MEIIKIVENEDGSATVHMNITEEENQMFIEYAVNGILKEQIQKTEGTLNEHRSDGDKG